MSLTNIRFPNSSSPIPPFFLSAAKLTSSSQLLVCCTSMRMSPSCLFSSRLAGGSVLVHCLGGISRSVTVTTAYMITVTCHNWMDALAAVQQARPIAKPNRGFREQLQEYQQGSLQQERAWFHQTYSLNKFDDEVQIKLLANEFYAAEKAKELKQQKYLENSKIPFFQFLRTHHFAAI